MRKDHQPLNTAEVKTFQSSIYIFIPLFLSSLSDFRCRPWGQGICFSLSQRCALFTHFSRLAKDIYLVHVCCEVNKEGIQWIIYRRGDGIKNHWDFHVNSLFCGIHKKHIILDTWIHFAYPTCKWIPFKLVSFCSQALLCSNVLWHRTNWNGMHKLLSIGKVCKSMNQ